MYELNYVKKRLRRVWVAIIGGVSATVVAALSIVSFLGRFVGTFTVNLDTGNVSLALFDSHLFENPTTYMRIAELPSFHEYTYSYFDTIGDDVIDSDQTDYLLGAIRDEATENPTSVNFFKFTYYVKNVGTVMAGFRMQIKIIDSQAGDDGRKLDDTLRVMLYSNYTEDDHSNKTVYARQSTVPHYDEDGQISYKEAISIREDVATPSEPFQGYAEVFESSDTIATISVNGFGMDQSIRYTLVLWLEGYDLQSNSTRNAPKDAKIKIGVEINAYEN